MRVPGTRRFKLKIGCGVERDLANVTAERAGAVFAILTVGAALDVDEWLGDMQASLESLNLTTLYRPETETNLPSGNWKATADG